MLGHTWDYLGLILDSGTFRGAGTAVCRTRPSPLFAISRVQRFIHANDDSFLMTVAVILYCCVALFHCMIVAQFIHSLDRQLDCVQLLILIWLVNFPRSGIAPALRQACLALADPVVSKVLRPV